MGQRLGQRQVLLAEMPRLEVLERIIYVPHDHLNQGFGALKKADPNTDVIVLVESARMTSDRPWHKERLFFLLSSARHFAERA